MNKTITLTASLFAAAALFAAGCSSSNTKTESTTTATKEAPKANDKTIVDIAVGAGTFKTLVTALKSAELVEALQGDGPFTVFAPTDEAFAKLPAGTVENLLKDKEALKKVLTYHVVSGKVMAKDVMSITTAKTLQGQSVAVDSSSGVKINNATVVKADIVAKNGVIHVIDTVLLPK